MLYPLYEARRCARRSSWYARDVSQSRTNTAESLAVDAAAARAERIAAMLVRWEAEDVTGEPEWDVEDIEPVTLAARGRTPSHKRS